MRDFWQQAEPEHVDGVLTVDPVTLSYLLGVVGPVSVGEVSLTTDNAVDFLLHQVYVDVADPSAQDAFFQSAAQAIFDRVTAGTPSPRGLLTTLARGVQERRVLVHSFDPQVQSHLDGTRIAGEVPTASTDAPQVGFYVNDNTGAKMSYYLRYTATVEAVGCEGGRQQLTGSAQMRSIAPPSVTSQPDYVTGGGVYGIVVGDQLDTYYVYGPVGGTITDMVLDGRPLKFESHQVDGRQVAVFVDQLSPGQRSTVTWHMETGAGQTGDTDLLVTPGVLPDDLSSTAPSACS